MANPADRQATQDIWKAPVSTLPWKTRKNLSINSLSIKALFRTGEIKIGTKARLIVDQERRKAIAANHSGTHILQAALKAVLGDHIKQSGSLVNAAAPAF